MFKVTSNQTFREGYALLAIFNNPDFSKAADNKLLNDYIVEIKRELRNWAHTDNDFTVGMGYPIYHRIVKDDGIDGFVELVTLPEICTTMDEAEEYFTDFVKIDCYPSAYDCTGRPFTSWYKLFQRGDKFYAYHRVSFDV